MKFLMLIKHAEHPNPELAPPSLHEAMGTFVEANLKSGILKETAGLKRTPEATRIRSKGGKLHTADGPFAESKEVVGGFAIVEVPTKAKAHEIGREFMEIHRVHWPEFECELEMRQYDEE